MSTNKKKINFFSYKVLRKICLHIFVLLGILLFLSDVNFTIVKATETELEKSIIFDFSGSYNNQAQFVSEEFIIQFDTAISSNDDSSGIVVNNNNNFVITTPSGKYISKIEFKGIGGASGFLENFYCPNGIVSYSQVDFDMETYEFYVLSTNSIVEYPNNVSSGSFTSLTDNNIINEIEVYYTETEPINYIVLDLSYGNIVFDSNKYTGYDVNGQYYEKIAYPTTQKFYIVQTVVDSTNNNIVRNFNPIDNYNISYNGKLVCDMVMDNIWSSYVSSSGDVGGLYIPTSADANDTYNKKVTVRLKGVNIFARITYWTGTDGYTTSLPSSSHLIFTSYYGDNSTEGKLIAIGKQTTKSNYTHGSLSVNGWHSVIGGTDGNSRVTGLKFRGGTVLAVATAKDQCTAIGAGGNGYGEIEISGGKVTAISYTTGTAIGGGIGHNSAGGGGKVTITGGEVNAYNLGQPYVNTFDTNKTLDIAEFVPGTAIGGGSSYLSKGEKGTVIISGGIVNAYSNGGSGLGGGNSILSTGGVATIDISGGNVTSYGFIPNDVVNEISTILGKLQTQVLNKINKGGTIIDSTIENYEYGSDGSGIGGGSGEEGNGGTATITISGGLLNASSIGGGNSKNARGAVATVTVTGGTTVCDTIGGGFSENYGYENGFVYVSGGSLNATMSAIPQVSKTDSSMIYLTRLSLLDLNDERLINTQIQELIFKNSFSYGTNETVTDDEGMLYVWLPTGADVTGAKVLDHTLVFEPYEEADGMISPYEIGILKETQNNKYNYYVNTVTTEYYTLYNTYVDGVLSNELENTTIVPSNTYFTIYAKVKDGYDANVYYAVELSNGNRVFQQASTATPGENIVSVGITINQNTTILYEVIGKDNDDHFFIMDLFNGNINVTEVDGQIIVEQNDYKFTLANGGLYVTSGGIVTPNTISVDIKQDSNGNNNKLDLFVNNIVISSDKSSIDIKSGTVILETGSTNDLIYSQNNSAINIEENAELIINADGEDAIKISSNNTNVSPVSGKGKVVFNNNDGYFQIVSSGSTPAFSVGIYECSGRNQYEAELYVGEFEFELIGYVQGTQLYDATVDMSGNTDNFSARGVYKVLNGVTSSKVYSTDVYEGNYVTNLKAIQVGDKTVVGSVVLKQGNLVLEENVHYTLTTTDEGKTYQLTIYGFAFEEGNIMIFAASENLIAYQIVSYEGIYDALPHTINVAVNTNLFIVYYSLDNTTWSTENPEFIDVTGASGVKVYIKITAISNELDYVPVTDVYGTVIIKEGVNEFTNSLTCIDVAYKEGEVVTPNPTIKVKWGTVYYKYYSDSECTDEVFTFQKDTYYYVKAFVDAGLGVNHVVNYPAIETSYSVRFKVVEVYIYTSATKTLNKAEGANSTITVQLDGAFSVLFHVGATASMSLCVENSDINDNTPALPVGTKITFIDFAIDSSEINKYYYYYVKESDITNTTVNIDIADFIKMGSVDETYVMKQNCDVQYQFCVEFPKDRLNSGQISFTLKGSSDRNDKTIYIASAVNSVEKIEVNAPVADDNSIEYTINVNADGSSKENQVLVVNLDVTEANGLNIKLFNQTGAEVPLNHSTGSLFFYVLSNYTDLNGSYTFKVENNNETTVLINSIIFDIRSTNSNIPYVLENRTTDNSKSITTPSFLNGHTEVEFMVTVEESSLVIDDETQMVFNYIINEPTIDYSQLTITIYRKNVNGGYDLKLGPLPLTSNTFNVPSSNILVNGTYRLVFKYKGIEYKMNIIIDR